MTGGEVGSAKRAFLGWRTTASAMLLIWAGIPFLSSRAVRDPEGLQDVAFAVLTMLAYCVGVLFVMPLYVFTFGQIVDRRTARRGLRRATITFGTYGFGFGVVLVVLAGMAALTPLGIAVVLLAPTLTAVVGRLLVELRGPSWRLIIWGTFAIAVAVALALILWLFHSGGS